ncbi:hypothetical protein HDV01_002050 [Terramyces sp. JEL0728]|nr:hypothetical protein HDV01_002050 [Terramyces sp. JEL0728]
MKFNLLISAIYAIKVVIPGNVPENESGSGCPPGSVKATISDDGTFLTVSYTSMISPVGTLPRTACQSSIDLRYGTDYVYSVKSIRLRGSTMFSSGVSGKRTVEYYHHSSQTVNRFSAALPGISTWQDYDIWIKVPDTQRIWTGWDGPTALNIFSQSLLVNATSTNPGYISVGYAGTVDEIYELEWKQCKLCPSIHPKIPPGIFNH